MCIRDSTEGKYDQDGILENVHTSIEVEADVTNIPSFLILNMEGLAAGESLSADKVILPAGVTLVSDPKMTVVHLSVRSAEVEETPVAAAPAEGAEGAAAAATPAEGEAAKDDKK